MKKRILSIVLSIVMLVSLLPTTAFAASYEVQWTSAVTADGAPDYVAENYRGTLQEAFVAANAAESTVYVTLLTNITASDGVFTLAAGKSMVLESSNTITINCSSNESVGISTEAGSSLMVVGGTISLSAGTGITKAYGIKAGGELTLKNCTVKVKNTDGNACTVYATAESDLMMTGCTVSAEGKYTSDGVLTHNGGTVTDCKITAKASNTGVYGINNQEGELTVSGGTITANTTGDFASCGIYVYRGNLIMDSGSASATGNGGYTHGLYLVRGSAELSGGSFTTGSYAYGASAIRYDYTPVTDLLADGYGYFINDTLQNLTDETSVGGSNKTVTVKEIPIPHAHDMSVACDGSGVTFEPWDGTGTPTGNVYLTGDVTLAETLIISSGTVNLCLNGYSITRSDWYPTIRIEDGATLNLCDCNGSGKNNGSVTNNFDVCVANDGALTVYGGTVEGPTWGITNRGTLTVYGGSVASTGERGIYNAEGTVYVYGGTVSGNSYGIYNEGGTANVTGGTVTATGSNFYGIYNRSNGTVTVSGGTVTATGSNSWGIYNHSDGTTDVDTTTNVSGTANVSGSFLGIYNSGTLTVSGGTVTATGSNGFGIYNFYHGAGSLELSGAPTITGATAGVYLDGGSITLGGELTYVEEKAISVYMDTPGTFTSGWTEKMGENAANYGSYFTAWDDGYTVQPDGSGELKLAEPSAVETHAHDMSVACGGSSVTFEPWDGTTTFPGGNVYLTDDITLTEALTISGTVNLCLNGHVLAQSGEGCVIVVGADSTLNLCDCNGISQSHKFTVNSGTGLWTLNETNGTESVTGGVITGGKYGGIYAEGELNQYGGHIVGNQSEDGGGVYLYGEQNSESDKYRMFGGSVIGNTATECGGGIYIYRFAEFELHGGTVSSNRAGEQGGGIYTEQGGGTYTKFTMTDGTVSGNTAADGGGIYSSCAITMSGGSITGNTASDTSGGVYARGTMTMSGGSITGNTAGTSGGGLYLYSSTTSYLVPSGKVIINNNTLTSGVNNNVYKNTSFYTPVKISGTLDVGSSIGISFGRDHTDYPFAEPDGDTVTSLATGYKDYFFSDDSAYVVVVDGNNLKLAEPSADETHAHDMSVDCGGSGVTFEPWDGTTTFPGGNVYLTDDITLTEELTISGTVNLCLNGHKITCSGTTAIVVNSGATLNICDCKGGGSVTNSGGTNSGGTTYGIYNSGTVNVYGGTISATTTATTTTAGSGSGIYNYSGQVTVVGTGAVVSGTFYGIYNNSTNGTVSVSAGKVSGKYGIYNKGKVIVGGEIEVTGTDYGISNSGTVSISGGTVQATSSSGHGIYSTSGTVSVSGGIVQATGSNSRGISVSGGTVSVSDGTVSGLTYGVYASSTGDITISGGEVSAINSASNSNSYGVYRLGSGAVEITGGTVSGKNGVYLYGSGNVTVSGGTVTGNGSGIYGYGIYLHSSSTGAVSVSGGTVSGTAYGVYTTGNSSGSVTVSGVANISGAQSGILHYGKGTVTVSGGTVKSPQRVTGTTSSGIKILTGSGNVTVSGGTVSGMDYGIYNGGTLTLSNAPTITGDTADIHLDSGKIITISGALTYTEENAISVKMDSAGTFTSGWTTKMGGNAANYGSYFTSANDGYIVQPDGNNELKLAEPPATIPVESVSLDKSSLTLDVGGTATLTATVLPDDATDKTVIWTSSDPTVANVEDGVVTAVVPGTATITATTTDGGKTATCTVTVNAKALSASNVTLSQDSFTYDGGEKKPTVTVMDGSTTLAEGTDYTITWPADCASVGTKTVMVTFTGNYSGSETVEYAIVAADSSCTVPAAVDNLVYTGSAQNLITAATPTGGTVQYSLSATGTFSESIPTGTDAGTYNVYYKVIGDANHNDTAPACVAVTIAKKQIAKPAADSSTFTYSGNYQTYAMNGDPAFIIDNNVQKNAGSYTVTVTLQDTANYEWTDGTTAVLEYSFKIEQKEIDIGWDATMFLPYTGNSLLPKATATNLVDGDTCTLTTEVVETTEGAGVIPGEWTAKVTALSNDNYKLPASGVRVIVTFEIVNGYQNYAPVVSGTNETIDGKGDGKITGVDNTMEYRKEGEISYTAVSGSEVTGLHDGIYYVRYAAKTYYNPSPEAQLTIGAGRKLTVTVPQNQIGYTLTVDKTEIEYMGGPTITLIIHEGYSKTESFAVKLNGNDMQWGDFTQIGTQSCTEDIVITVEGVADITAPSAEIDIKNNKWTSFWNGVTFGLFFNETQDVTITATDTGSGVNSIQYYLASDELEIDEVRAITDWVDYNGTFKIDPNNHYVVYAKITDNAGNTLYINSDGLVLDNIAPTLEGIENGKTYYGDLTVIKSDEQFYDIRVVTLDGEEMGFAEGTYGLIPADNAEHIVVVQDHAGNKTTYTVTVMKNYTVTYKADGETVSTETVGHGKDATLPAVPAKEGFVGKWDAEGKNITNDTTISVVYTAIPAVKPDEVKPENKSDLEDAKAKLEEMLEDDSYTDNDKKDIQDAIDDIDDALEVIGNVEAVEDLIDKLPENITKNDEDAIKAADDAYNALSDYEKSLVDEDAKKALDDAKAALAELNKPADTDSPQTGDNSNMFLWIALLFISGGALITLTVVDRKRRMASKR